MKESEVHTGMIVEVWNPTIYLGSLTKYFQINGRVIAIIIQKYNTYCSIEVCHDAWPNGTLIKTCTRRDVRYKDLREHKMHGTKWWM